ncbi:hypothetical protein FBU59_007214, partial [Linderina macrospora]
MLTMNGVMQQATLVAPQQLMPAIAPNGDILSLEDIDEEFEEDEDEHVSDKEARDAANKAAAAAAAKQASAQQQPKLKKKPAPYKRFRNSFIFFANDRRAQWRRDHPEDAKIQNREFIQEMSKVWNQMTDEDKVPYVRMADEDKLRYEADVKKYGPLPQNAPTTYTSGASSASTKTAKAPKPEVSLGASIAPSSAALCSIAHTSIAPKPAAVATASIPVETKTTAVPLDSQNSVMTVPPRIAARPEHIQLPPQPAIMPRTVDSAPMLAVAMTTPAPTSATLVPANHPLGSGQTTPRFNGLVANPLAAFDPVELSQTALALQAYQMMYMQHPASHDV